MTNATHTAGIDCSDADDAEPVCERCCKPLSEMETAAFAPFCSRTCRRMAEHANRRLPAPTLPLHLDHGTLRCTCGAPLTPQFTPGGRKGYPGDAATALESVEGLDDEWACESCGVVVGRRAVEDIVEDLADAY